MAKQVVQAIPVNFGCDPEFFFTGPDGGIVGAERILPAEGLDLTNGMMKEYELDATGHYQYDGNGLPKYTGRMVPSILKKQAFVIDGVQAELNPSAYGCRANMSNHIGACFKMLKEHLAKTPGIKVCFDPVVELKPHELDGLSDRARVFGCAPSLNYYDKFAEIGVDAGTYMKRSAGGHIHLGIMHYRDDSTNMYKVRERLVPLLDIFVGNTCVLIDRDPNAKERRKVYGRAGEYRLPNHGLEYRTLSNFWLQAYPLFSMVMGLTRLAGGVLHAGLSRKPPVGTGYTQKQWDSFYPDSSYWDGEAEILAAFGVTKDGPRDEGFLRSVRDAINNNDVDLAWKNWAIVRKFIADHTNEAGTAGGCALDCGSLDSFEFFAQTVQKHGLKFWFDHDIMEHWITKGDGHGKGFESFLVNTVPQRKAEYEKNLVVLTPETEPVIVEQPVVPKKQFLRDASGRFMKRAA